MNSAADLADASWRTPWRTCAGWLIVALLIRGASAERVTHPGYMDAYYSYHVAENVLAGRGLTEDVVWNYLSPPASLPRPSNAYWPPGTALLAAAGSRVAAVFAPGEVWAWRRMQVAPVLIASLVVVGAYAMCRRLAPGAGAAQRATVVAGLMLSSGVYFPYWTTTDGFAPFALLGGASLWLAAEAAADRPRRSALLFAAGLCAGLALSIRPDSFLLLCASLVAAPLQPPQLGTPSASPTRFAMAEDGNEGVPSRTGRPRWRWLSLLVPLIGFGLGAAPWLARNWLTWSRLFPPGAAAALWLREYDDLFAFGEPSSFDRWWAAGLPAALAVRAQALLANAGVFGQPLLYYLLPALMFGAWRLRRQPVAWVPGTYLVMLWAAMSLCFPFASVRGGFFHSLVALLPFLLLWTVTGVQGAVAAAARRRRWNEAYAQWAFSLALIVFGTFSSAYFGAQLPRRWDARLAAYQEAAQWLSTAADPDARVMVADPAGFWYASGRSAVVIPSDGPAAVVAVALQFHVEYLLIERAAPRFLAGAYNGSQATPDLEYVATVHEIGIYRISPRELPQLAHARWGA